MRPYSFTPAAVLALCLAAPAAGQDRHPIATRVQADLKDPAKPFALVIAIKVKADAADKFEAAFARARTETRKEKVNVQVAECVPEPGARDPQAGDTHAASTPRLKQSLPMQGA